MKTPGPGFASHLRTKFVSTGDIQGRVDGVSKQFAGAGWKNLPQELVDEILGYLPDDPNALKACSLTCKPLFGATRPIIHQRVYFPPMSARVERPTPRESVFGFRREGPETFERLTDVDRSGLLRYTRYLTFQVGGGLFSPENMRKYLPYLRSITNLHTLTLAHFRVLSLIPVFNECFGTFANTLRHLSIRNAYVTDQQLLYIISQFPLLEDLTIISLTGAYPGHPVPTTTQSPLLRGTLILVDPDTREFSDCLATLPGGLNFRSLEFFRCNDPRAVLDACGHSVRSISYLWCKKGGTEGLPLDLKRSVVLERFEFAVRWPEVSTVPGWIHQTLRTITSPLFNELVIWILHVTHPWGPPQLMNSNGWKVVDASLVVLAGRNPDFRVVVRGGFAGGNRVVRQRIESDYLPLASLNGILKFEQVPNVQIHRLQLRVP